jgi:hypothetical protein
MQKDSRRSYQIRKPAGKAGISQRMAVTLGQFVAGIPTSYIRIEMNALLFERWFVIQPG